MAVSRPHASTPRQPLLWAALAFAAGLFAGPYIWRPPSWWIVAAGTFLLSAVLLLRRRPVHSAFLALGVLFFAGILAIQLRPCTVPGSTDILAFADGRIVEVTAHVTGEGLARQTAGELRQAVDLETESVREGVIEASLRSGLRLHVYGKADSAAESVHMYRYGERLRFPVKLYPPRNFRNPGAFDYRGYLASNGIAALGSVKAAEVEVLPGFSGSARELWRTRVHRSTIARIHQLWPENQAGLVDAMVIGEAAFIERDTRADFQRSGTYHVLVISGMNVGILALVTFWLLRRLRVGDIAASVATVLLSVAYAFITDVGPPIWRATLMLAIYLGVRLLYRDRSMLNAIGGAALTLLAIDPSSLSGPSFQLTFLCVLLIAGVGAPILERNTQPYQRGLPSLERLAYDVSLPHRVVQFRIHLRMVSGRLQRFLGRRIPSPVLIGVLRFGFSTCELLIISALMQVGLVLPMARYFHRATLAGLPANLLVVPLTELLMPAAIMAVLLSYVSFALARIPVLAAGLALQGISGTVHWLGGLRIADVRMPEPQRAAVMFAIAALALSLALARRRWYLAGTGLTLLAAAAVWICVVPPRAPLQPGVVEVTAIDVGQGDSILLVSPDGHTLLIDAGGIPHWMHSELDIGEDVVSPYLWARGIRRLDAVAITHAHADHMGGMPAVLANFHPRELWLGVDTPSADLEKLLSEAAGLGISTIPRKAGDTFDFGGASIRILAPAFDANAQAWRPNDDSMVMKVSYGNTSALLEGDAERATEQRIAVEDPQADLLKVAHHGSASSTMPNLLAAVHPRFAVISAGARNVYGHPRVEVLSRLAQLRVSTYRTDLDGAVTFYLDGKRVTYLPENLR